MFLSLFKYYEKLLPNYNESLGQIISYILYNPESDLRLKSLSENLHINKSYLSTVFIAQTGIRFVDYITNIKLMRGAWLLKNTDMKVSEIALRLDYKDTAYFSKKFRQMFNITPSEYRLPDDYIFEI
jgi:two-component system response regulator YesN